MHGLVKHCEIRVGKNRPEKLIETCFEEIRIQLEDRSADYVSLNDISRGTGIFLLPDSQTSCSTDVLQQKKMFHILKCLKEMKKSCF